MQAPRWASPQAAASEAAYTVLRSLFPNLTTSLWATMAQSLAAIPAGPARAAGVVVGRKVADGILAWRANDGSAVSVPYAPGTAPGQWRPTPPDYTTAWGPEWGSVNTFAIASAAPYLPPPPPALNSPEYAAALNQVESLGAVNSTARTPDQTQVAIFWSYDLPSSGTPPVHNDQAVEEIALEQHNTLAQNARLFGLINVAQGDTAIAAWNAKYAYNFWRPVTAIRLAGTDGNPATAADPTWTPLGAPNDPGQPSFTPPFPSYMSGHATFAGTVFTVLADFYGTDNIPFTITSDMLPGVTRSYDSFSAASLEVAWSRVYLGVHFWFDESAGMSTGDALGNNIFNQIMGPAHPAAELGGKAAPRSRPAILVVALRHALCATVFLRGSGSLDSIRLHSWSLLSAAAREPLAGDGRAARLGLSVSRLERTHHRRVLRARTPSPACSTQMAASHGLSTIIHASVLILGRPCWPGSRTMRPTSTSACSTPTATARRYFGGHGSAMAQVYNHIIMPLANDDDRRTQVAWGIRDFRHRFGREPEGMWLAETAVDIPTLEVLAEYGVRFTVLAPNQAARVRRVGSEEWTDVSGGADRSLRLLRPETPVRPLDRSVLLRWTGVAGRRVREAADARRDPRRPVDLGVLGPARGRPAGPYRHRRRILRPPPPARRHGPGLRPRPSRRDPRSDPDQLRRVPRKAPAAVGSRDLREFLLELRPRRRALAVELRMQLGPARLASRMARAPASRPRWAPRRRTRPLRAACVGAAQRSLGRPQRLHRRPARPVSRNARRLASRGTPDERSRPPSASRPSSCWRCSAMPC